MRILALGPHTDRLPLTDLGLQPTRLDDPLSLRYLSEVRPDAIVSFGYRHIIPREIISEFKGVMMNLHISFLPWNRGSHPNFWAWLENSPHGVTLHRIDEGIDTGPFFAQRRVPLSDQLTLRQSHSFLHDEMVKLFAEYAGKVLHGSLDLEPQLSGGSFHRSAEISQFSECLSNGWDTRCSSVKQYGLENGLWVRS